MRSVRVSVFCCLVGGAVLASACAASRGPAPAPALTPSTTAAPIAKAPALPFEQTGIVASWMDPAVDPCQDYFAYACGGFVKNVPIPADSAEWGISSIIRKDTEDFLRSAMEKAAASPAGDPVSRKLGDYYAACTDEDAIERAGAAPIKPLLAEIARVRDVKTLTAAITSLHAESVFALFVPSADPDFKDATRYIADLDQSGLGLPERDYYLKDDGNRTEVRAFYTGHVGTMLALLGMKPAEVKAAVADVLRIETKLATLQQDEVTRRDPNEIYHPMQRSELAALAKTFPWDSYFAALHLPDVPTISVSSPSYFTGVDALLRAESPAAWRHYLAWQVAHVEAPRLSRSFRTAAFALRQKLSGQEEIEPRWKTCLRAVDQDMGELVAQPYVAAKLAGDSREQAVALVSAIHEAMRTELTGLAWLDDTTRAGALTKLDAVAANVGYPETWRAYDFETSRRDFIGNRMAAERFELHRTLGKAGRAVDRKEWLMTPATVNASYGPDRNVITLPAAELQPPIFSSAFYAPVNLGDEGASTVGHELTHGFDDSGSRFDGAGNLRNWWSADTKARFDQATKCVEDQYSAYDVVPGVKVNGALSLGENIADIGGVKLGYIALEAWEKAHPGERRSVSGYTDEQLFFLGYAQGWCQKDRPEGAELNAHSDPHAPARWRVNGPMVNVPAFAEAYQCKTGTPMNSGKACSVW